MIYIPVYIHVEFECGSKENAVFAQTDTGSPDLMSEMEFSVTKLSVSNIFQWLCLTSSLVIFSEFFFLFLFFLPCRDC